MPYLTSTVAGAATASAATGTGATTTTDWCCHTALVFRNRAEGGKNTLCRAPAPGTCGPFLCLTHRAQKLKLRFAVGTYVFVNRHFVTSIFSLMPFRLQSQASQTTLPSIIVISTLISFICSGGDISGSSVSTTISASLPGAIEPLISSS